MFKKILLPIDMSDRHQQALDATLELAGRSGGEVVLLHVIEVIAGLPPEEEPTFYSRLERKAAAHLERLAASLAGGSVTVRGEVVYGERVREVVAYAARTAADIIILTSPRPEPEHPAAGLGSLSYRIGLFCGCPVLLVK